MKNLSSFMNVSKILRHIRLCWGWSFIRTTEWRTAISIVSTFLTIIMSGVRHWGWMQNRQQGPGCSMICSYMTGIPTPNGQETVFTEWPIRKRHYRMPRNFLIWIASNGILSSTICGRSHFFLCRGQKKDGLRHLLTSIAAVLRLHSGRRAIR